MMNWQTLKQALLAILIGALANVAVQVLQLLTGFAITYLQHIIGASTGATAYLYAWKIDLFA